MKWLRAEFGYQFLPSDFEGENPPLDEHSLDWHLTYSSVFNDPAIQEALAKHRDRFDRKGVFSALLELKER